MPELGKSGHQKALDKAASLEIPFHYYTILNGTLTTPFVFIILSGAYYILYHFEFSFIEKYKANDKPWPWYEMGREKWNEFLKDTLKSVCFNNLIFIHVFTLIDLLIWGTDGYYSKGFETWPDRFTFCW